MCDEQAKPAPSLPKASLTEPEKKHYDDKCGNRFNFMLCSSQDEWIYKTLKEQDPGGLLGSMRELQVLIHRREPYMYVLNTGELRGGVGKMLRAGERYRLGEIYENAVRYIDSRYSFITVRDRIFSLASNTHAKDRPICVEPKEPAKPNEPWIDSLIRVVSNDHVVCVLLFRDRSYLLHGPRPLEREDGSISEQGFASSGILKLHNFMAEVWKYLQELEWKQAETTSWTVARMEQLAIEGKEVR